MSYLKQIAKVCMYCFSYLLNYPGLLLNHVKTGGNCLFRGLIYFKAVGRGNSRITIGSNVRINSSLNSNPIGGQTKTVLYVRGEGRIEIGDRVGISNTAIVADQLVQIGEDSCIGGGTKIYDTDFHSLGSADRLNGDWNVHSRPVLIGKRVFIGAHCIILKGVTIGDDAVVGAGSVVTHNIPSREMWAGNPAVFIRRLNNEEINGK